MEDSAGEDSVGRIPSSLWKVEAENLPDCVVALKAAGEGIWVSPGAQAVVLVNKGRPSL